MATVALRQPLLNRVSWGALFAGFFFGFGIWMLLLALGAGIGFSSFDPSDLGQWQGLGIGVGIWGVISGIIAMFLAGWLTARLSVSESKVAGMLHGAALWGFMLVAGIWIAAMTVARTAGAAAQAVGGAAQTAGQAVAQNPSVQQEARQRSEQARQQAQELKQQAEQNKGEAAAAAKKAGFAGSWAFFLYGILTLAAAILGGRAGVPRERIVHGREEPLPAPGAPLSPQRA
jgi:ABC-type multidrug transport system fused ATPase/permease subunit